MVCILSEREKAAVQNIHWLIDHPEQQPDSVTADGWLIFHFRKDQPERTERRQISPGQFDRLVQTRTALLQKKTNESFRKCYFWAQEQILRDFEIRENEMRKAA